MPFFIWLPEWDIKPTLEVRERFERRIDKDLTRTNNDNRSDLYSRYRIGMDLKGPNKLTGRIVYQYAHDLSWQKSANAGKVNSDIIEAYVALPTEVGSLTAGRQIFGIGSERLLGSGEWGNNGRSWNMVRLANARWDVFAGQLAANSVASKNAIIGGVTFKSRAGLTLAVYKHDKSTAAGVTDMYTLDHRWTATSKKFSFDVEAAGQAGRAGTHDVRAFAGVGKVSYAATPKVSVYVAGDVASGGKRGNTVLTFDQLYPNCHTRYGIVDTQGWRNMKALTVGVCATPTKKLSVIAEYDRFGLWAANDSWYAAGGSINKSGSTSYSDPTGAKGTDTGDEFDLSACYKLDLRNTFDAGVGLFRPGHFQKSFAGLGDRNEIWGYVQYRFKF